MFLQDRPHLLALMSPSLVADVAARTQVGFSVALGVQTSCNVAGAGTSAQHSRQTLISLKQRKAERRRGGWRRCRCCAACRRR